MHWLCLPPEELTATSDPFLGASNEDNRFIIDTLIRHIDPNRRV